jgi:tellurite methyltransferase
MEGGSLEPDWDTRYREGFCDGRDAVHDLVRRFAPAIVRTRPVADIAMGRGWDAIFLARSGFIVYGLERSIEAIGIARRSAHDERVKIRPVLGDAGALPFKAGSLSAVLVFNYLDRAIMPDLVRLLARGGVILYETFLKRQTELATGGPKNPAFLLEDGELIERFRSLELLFYEEGVFGPQGNRKAVARYAGRKR